MTKKESKLSNEKVIEFEYKNYRGEIAARKVIPKEIWFGSTEWHPKEQWLMKAYDLNKEAERDFALRDIIQFL